MKRIPLILITIILCSCQDPKNSKEYIKIFNDLKLKDSLLNDCLNGSEKLESKADYYWSKKNIDSTLYYINKLIKFHPETSQLKKFTKIKQVSLDLKKQDSIKLVKEIEEKERLKNINNTGIWSVSYYVDDFGEPTKQGYIQASLTGLFSNSATHNSDLGVRFLITSSSDINIKLFEYNRSNPLKSYGTDYYRVLVKDHEGKKYKLDASNWSDRLSFSKNHSRILHSVLLKGGIVKFSIYEKENSVNEYKFQINEAKYYDNAYRILTKGK